MTEPNDLKVPNRRRERLLALLPVLSLLICSATYAVFFGYLSILRLDSFNSSVNDLGFFNEVMWITTHGGPNVWATSVQANFQASYPWQSGSFLVLVPAYLAFPSPVTLLVAQAIALPLATIPIYLLARVYGVSRWGSFALGGCYLLNFQVQSVNLNDFHLQSFFPLTFLSMILFYEYGWKRCFVAAGVISMATNPLTLALTLGFLGVLLINESSPHLSLSKLAARALDWVRSRNAEFALLLFGVALTGFELSFGGIAGYHFGQSAAQTAPQGYLSNLSIRVLYFIMAFAPFLGVALLVRETIVLAVPLTAFLAIGDLSYFGYFGRQDTLEFLVVALWGLMLFVRKYADARLAPKTEGRVRELGTRISPGRRIPVPTLTIATTVVVSTLLFAGLSPISPWNQVPQLVSSVNENPSDIANVTPADHFLASAAELIPPAASVLTQNNIPQLTDRDSFEWAFPNMPHFNVSQFEYILSDESDNAFAQFWYTYLQPYVEYALDSNQFGVLAIGYGVLLLERGYHGQPQLVGPLPYSPVEMELASGYLNSSTAFHPAQNDSVFWYGPYVDLPPGNYTATYRLLIGTGVQPSAHVVSVAVYNYTEAGPDVYASSTLFGYNFPAANTWINATLNFTLNSFVISAEFPGLAPTNASTLEFGGVTITVGHTARAPYVKLPVTFQAAELPLASGTYVGPVAIHGTETNSTFWYGPYAELPPGRYAASFQLAISNLSIMNSRIIELAIESYSTGAPVFYNTSNIYAPQFHAPGAWANFTVNFTLNSTTYGVQFSGLNPTNALSLSFAGVTLSLQAQVLRNI